MKVEENQRKRLIRNRKYHLVDPAGGNLDPVAGFTTVAMPNVAVEEALYREGTFKYTQKYPGIPVVGDITLTKGIFRRDSDFFNWVLKAIDGGQEYRTELVLQEFHITDELGINGSPSRITRLREVWAKDAKPTSDKDSSSSNISITSLILACESFDVELINN